MFLTAINREWLKYLDILINYHGHVSQSIYNTRKDIAKQTSSSVRLTNMPDASKG